MRRNLFVLLLAVISFVALSSQAYAACSTPTIGSNLVLRFPAAQGIWTGAASTIKSEDNANTTFNTAGVLYYDTTANALKLCDGTDWITLGDGGGGGGGGGGADGPAGRIQLSNGAGGFISSPAFYAADYPDSSSMALELGTATRDLAYMRIWGDKNSRLEIGNNGTDPGQSIINLYTKGIQWGSPVVKYWHTFARNDAWEGDEKNHIGVQFYDGTNFIPAMMISPNGSVSISSTVPNASAALDVNSTTRGFLPPRLTTTQRDAITSPATGLMIYNTTTNALEVYNGTTWGAASSGGGASDLSDLGDVDVTGVVAGQSLVYNGTTWEPQTITGGTGGGFALGTPIVAEYNTNHTFTNECRFILPTSLTIPNAGYYVLETILRGYLYGGSVVKQLNVEVLDSSDTVVSHANISGSANEAHYLLIDNTAIKYLPAGTYTVKVQGSNGSGNCNTFNWNRMSNVSVTAREILGGGGSGGASDLADLGDVDVTGVTAGQSLVFNGTKWEPQTITGGGGASTPLATGMAWRTAGGVASDSVYTDIPLNAGNANLVGITHSTTTNPARMTVTKKGKYLAAYTMTGVIRPSSAATFSAILAVNGATVPGTVASTANDPSWSSNVSGTAILDLNAGDYVTIQAMQNAPDGTYNNATLVLTEIGAFGGGVTDLADLGDVDVSGATAGQSLVFNGTKWEPQTITGGSGAPLTVSQSVGSAQSTTSTSYVDIPEMSITFTSNGGPTLLMANFTTYNNTASASANFRLMLDGTPVDVKALQYTGANDVKATVLSAIPTLTAGTHTVKVQWLTSTGTLVAGWVAHHNHLFAIELNGGGSGSGAESLADLTDVDLSGATPGQSLVFNGTTWEPQTITGGGSGAPTAQVAFNVNRNNVNQTVSPDTWTPVTWTNKVFDQGNAFNLSTGRFQPSVAGYYQINLKANCPPSGGGVACQVSIYKNGNRYSDDYDYAPSASSVGLVSDIVYLNGTTDYVQAYIYNQSGNLISGDSLYTNFSGALLSGGSGAKWDDVTSGVIRYNGTSAIVGSGSAADNATNSTPTVHMNGDGYVWLARNHTSGNGMLFLQNLKAGASNLVQFMSGNTIVGSISTDGTGTAYNTTSDARLKENVTDSERGLDTLMRIDVKDFNFISDEAKTRVQGFIAQQLHTVYPEAVTPGDNEKSWNVDYGRITPLIVKSIQDLKTENDELKHQVNDLQQQIDTLRSVIEAMQAKE